MERESTYKSVVAGTGIVGAVVVFVFLVLGPLSATPAPSGLTITMMLAYPALLFSTASVGIKSMRAVIVVSAIAIGCALIGLVSIVRDEHALTVLWILVIVCSPAIAQVVTARAAVREEVQADEAWRISRGFQAPEPQREHTRNSWRDESGAFGAQNSGMATAISLFASLGERINEPCWLAGPEVRLRELPRV
jgi:hypothetical protein